MHRSKAVTTWSGTGEAGMCLGHEPMKTGEYNESALTISNETSSRHVDSVEAFERSDAPLCAAARHTQSQAESVVVRTAVSRCKAEARIEVFPAAAFFTILQQALGGTSFGMGAELHLLHVPPRWQQHGRAEPAPQEFKVPRETLTRSPHGQ